ncbi:MAG: hypothetical protein P8141_02180 [Gammaproteobacteria bacterium]
MLLTTLLLLWRHGAVMRELWLEPVLRRPVLIFESDDWGPGESVHSQRLQRLADILNRYRDAQGHHPVTTLGIVLAIPDQRRMREQGGARYIALTLADARFAEMRDVIQQGMDHGVFSVQLHGMEHYWPPALMTAAKANDVLASWLKSDYPRTEALPASLQSRWIDASVLPSQAHSWPQIESAVNDEVTCFAQVFGYRPSVVVPPTFVWSQDVERAWANNGVRTVVTPGTCYTGRDARGDLIASGASIRNGMRNAQGLVYLVRDDYFEPAKGHRAERAWTALKIKARCGRPTLLEMHRFNFIDDPTVAERSYAELARVIEGALHRYPNLVFMNTEMLAKAMADGEAALFESGIRRRLQAWCWRVREETRVWRMARYTGLAVFFMLLRRCTVVTEHPSPMKV